MEKVINPEHTSVLLEKKDIDKSNHDAPEKTTNQPGEEEAKKLPDSSKDPETFYQMPSLKNDHLKDEED